jgi:glutathione S-transferase
VKLYWHPFSVFPRRVRIALREKDLACDDVSVDVRAGAQHAAEFRRLNPFGRIPMLEDGDIVICESVAILEYLEDRYPNPPLLARDAATRARTRQLMQWSDELARGWKACAAPLLRPDVRRDDASVHEGRDAVAAHLDVLEAQLAAGHDAWLAGAYSLADVCYAPFVTTLGLLGLNELLAARPTTRAWIARLAARRAVAETAPS